MEDGFAVVQLGPLGGANTLYILDTEWGLSQKGANAGPGTEQITPPPLHLQLRWTMVLKSCIAPL